MFFMLLLTFICEGIQICIHNSQKEWLINMLWLLAYYDLFVFNVYYVLDTFLINFMIITRLSLKEGHYNYPQYYAYDR